jgi:NDP-sugar pyrophosphorylase family protein
MVSLKTAIIIAGGKGTRFEERVEDLPKPLIPISGKPILERVISWLRKNGVENIIIGVAYKKEKIKEYFGDGSRFGVRIQYTEHDENGGTEDAFKTAIEKSNIQDENFYAMNGDQITDLQLEGLTHAHLRNDVIVTIVTLKLRTKFGIIEVNRYNKITEFQEKYDIPNVLMNSGIYVFNRRIKEYLEGGDIEENAFRKLVNEGKIQSFYYDGIWLTINDKKELKKAEEFLQNGQFYNKNSI